MKHNFNSADVRRHWHGKSMPPLRTARELAAEFGLSLSQFSARIRCSEDSPKPVFKLSGSSKARNTWYNPAEVRAWWEKHNLDTVRLVR